MIHKLTIINFIGINLNDRSPNYNSQLRVAAYLIENTKYLENLALLLCVLIITKLRAFPNTSYKYEIFLMTG